MYLYIGFLFSSILFGIFMTVAIIDIIIFKTIIVLSLTICFVVFELYCDVKKGSCNKKWVAPFTTRSSNEMLSTIHFLE